MKLRTQILCLGLAGAALAFILLIFWQEEDEHPPGRSLAAFIAGLWVALTVWAFWASTHTYVRYAKDGFNYIPPSEMPRDALSGSYALVEKYPGDPRAHLYRGLYFLHQYNAGTAVVGYGGLFCHDRQQSFCIRT